MEGRTLRTFGRGRGRFPPAAWNPLEIGGPERKNEATGNEGIEKFEVNKPEEGGGGKPAWERNKLEIPPMEYDDEESEEETTPEELAERKKKPEKPEFNRKIRNQEGTDRYFLVETKKALKLPRDCKLTARLLCIDADDVLYLRCEDPEQDEREHKLETLGKLRSCLKSFYCKYVNQAALAMGQNSWLPVNGEVVIVRVKRTQLTSLSLTAQCQYPRTRTEFQRAVVRDVNMEGVTVELLDNYGIGGVAFCYVYKILPRYTHLPPQLFQCELADMELLDYRKMVQVTVQKCPIPNIFPDCEMNPVFIEWLGEYGKSGRPLVETLIQIKSSLGQKVLPLKTHVYRNLKNVLKPFVHLLEGTPRVKVLHADSKGFLWVKFEADEMLQNRIDYALDHLVPHYHKIRNFCHLNVCNLPRGDPGLEHNCKRLFAVVLANVGQSKEQGTEALYRVSISQVFPDTNEVEVECVDHYFSCKVKAWELVPLYNLYPDLSYIPPLVIAVHMHKIAELKTEVPEVKQAFQQKNLELKLINEWPLHIYPPEISILEKKKDYGESFVKNGWARKLEEHAFKIQSEKIREFAQTYQRRMNEADGGFQEELESPTLQLELAQTFAGGNYKFLWDGYRKTTSSRSSTRSSSASSRNSESD